MRSVLEIIGRELKNRMYSLSRNEKCLLFDIDSKLRSAKLYPGRGGKSTRGLSILSGTDRTEMQNMQFDSIVTIEAYNMMVCARRLIDLEQEALEPIYLVGVAQS